MIGLSMIGDPGIFVVLGSVGMGNAEGTFFFSRRLSRSRVQEDPAYKATSK